MSSMVGHTRARAQTPGSRVSTTPQLQQPTRVQPAASTDSSFAEMWGKAESPPPGVTDGGANRTAARRRRGVRKKRSQERRKPDLNKILG